MTEKLELGPRDACIIGAGPAGLMAAERLLEAGKVVHLFDAMPSVGRKFLLAGKGGLNLTHSEPIDHFMAKYGNKSGVLQPALDAFSPTQLREWAGKLGIDTFVGTSGRVFPKDLKAAPLLRAWLHRLRTLGLNLHTRHKWKGWNDDGALVFITPTGVREVRANATVLALGGASWSRLGSDGAWVPWLQSRGVDIATLKPSNCGFEVEGAWSPFFAEKFAGQPFKAVALAFTSSSGQVFSKRGEFVATATGVEGSLVYAASALLRDEIESQGSATFMLDLIPVKSYEEVLKEVKHPRGSRSLSSHLKSRLGIDGIKAAVLYEILGKDNVHDAEKLARGIKALPVRVVKTRPIDEAISTAGGVKFEALDDTLMCRAMPGLFCAGEMLDWEAPTGGYLMNASLATGAIAGQAAAAYLANI